MVAIACRVCPAATPHTRGSTFYCKLYNKYREGYPAYAGIDLGGYRRVYFRARLPRIRGDRPECGEPWFVAREATPHTRGSTPR